MSSEMMDVQKFAAELVTSTREYIYIRPEDGLLIMRPNRMHHLNEVAVDLLLRLYNGSDVPDARAAIKEVAAKYEVAEERVEADLRDLLLSVVALLKDDVCGAPANPHSRTCSGSGTGRSGRSRRAPAALDGDFRKAWI